MTWSDSGGAFSLDLIVAFGIFSLLLAVTMCLAMGSVASAFSEAGAGALGPAAERIGDVIVRSPGSPTDWYRSPDRARSASIVGLSDGPPNVLSSEKIAALNLYNASELGRRFNPGEPAGQARLRIEVASDDGTISTAAGYEIGDDSADVCRSVRLVVVRQPDGVERPGKVVVLLWGEHVGSQAGEV